jgi:UDP-N-acetylglucosamine--N-acetylmuramyl-(pentapeptide) pyrophosphoryl-undecaprenol N-acetylglucosamine transferase
MRSASVPGDDFAFAMDPRLCRQLADAPAREKARATVGERSGQAARARPVDHQLAEARERFGLTDAPTVLVTGGSLGAQRLNDAFADAVATLSAAGVQVLHVAGTGKAFVPDAVPGVPYVVLEYCDRMDLAYAAADLVVARSGANTVCELTAVGLPAVYVPLPVGNGEQRVNAADVVTAGGGLLVDDADLTPEWVDAVLLGLATDRERISQMAAAARALGEPAADEKLADLVDRAAEGRNRT